ncbi:MAG TPA: hypothetical protein VF682_13030 [Pseudomonas sp.]
MMLNSANRIDDHSARLSFNKSTAMVWVAISLIVIETFSGALRYYLDQAGLSPVLYLPKVGCLILLLIELRTYKAGRVLWLSLLMLVISAVLAMLHGATLNNVAFTLFALSPLLFGMVCSDHLIHRRRLLMWVIGLCLLASLLGLALDKFTSVPWKGYSYSIGETQLSANTSWSAEDEDRSAGFARVSNVLSILIAIYSLYVAMFLRSRLLILALSLVALYGIVLTTSKAPAGGYLLTMGLLLIARMRWTTRIACVLAVAIGMLLPLMGLLHDFDARTVSSAGTSLSSLYDRLINTWPNLVHAMNKEGFGYTGAGFGLFGSSVIIFPVPGADMFGGSDSTFMYLWGMFGVFGPLLYALQIPLFFALSNDESRVARALLAITFCCCLISWTTDMFEVAVANLFVGLAIGHVLSGKLLDSRKTSRPQPLQLSTLPSMN